ncbi:hypothetical protein GmRootV118_20490 [Variovorax sp. V118]|uniref:hypothetical protein n=1 Tax=Variovorax sp. V118 TaxID=3065954 RepID=UPI0034E87E80
MIEAMGSLRARLAPDLPLGTSYAIDLSNAHKKACRRVLALVMLGALDADASVPDQGQGRRGRGKPPTVPHEANRMLVRMILTAARVDEPTLTPLQIAQELERAAGGLPDGVDDAGQLGAVLQAHCADPGPEYLSGLRQERTGWLAQTAESIGWLPQGHWRAPYLLRLLQTLGPPDLEEEQAWCQELEALEAVLLAPAPPALTPSELARAWRAMVKEGSELRKSAAAHAAQMDALQGPMRLDALNEQLVPSGTGRALRDYKVGDVLEASPLVVVYTMREDQEGQAWAIKPAADCMSAAFDLAEYAVAAHRPRAGRRGQAQGNDAGASVDLAQGLAWWR